jgi:hypothetical protein
MIKIEDNFLNTQVFKNIQELYFSNQIPWTYGEVVYDHELKSDTFKLDNYQFSHLLYSYEQPSSNLFEQIVPVLNSIDLATICKVKVNMNTRTSKIVEHGFHTDVPFKCKTSILYLNTNDGYTIFEDGTKIESVENRLVTFDSHIKHSGTSCTNQKVRLVLNMNYFAFDPT